MELKSSKIVCTPPVGMSAGGFSDDLTTIAGSLTRFWPEFSDTFTCVLTLTLMVHVCLHVLALEVLVLTYITQCLALIDAIHWTPTEDN